MTRRKVDEAIRLLVKRRDRINFNSVAEMAGVSKPYLYAHPDVRQRIDTLRRQQEGLPSPRQVKLETSDASKDVLLAAKNKRIAELETEIRRLKEELKKSWGAVYGS